MIALVSAALATSTEPFGWVAPSDGAVAVPTDTWVFSSNLGGGALLDPEGRPVPGERTTAAWLVDGDEVAIFVPDEPLAPRAGYVVLDGYGEAVGSFLTGDGPAGSAPPRPVVERIERGGPGYDVVLRADAAAVVLVDDGEPTAVDPADPVHACCLRAIRAGDAGAFDDRRAGDGRHPRYGALGLAGGWSGFGPPTDLGCAGGGAGVGFVALGLRRRRQ